MKIERKRWPIKLDRDRGVTRTLTLREKKGREVGTYQGPAALTVVGFRTPRKENRMKRKNPNSIRKNNKP
jgi:hypothetical protein